MRKHIADRLYEAGVISSPDPRSPEVEAWADRFETEEEFEKALSATWPVSRPAGHMSRVGMTVTRHYGPVSISFALEQDFVRIGDKAAEVAASRWLYQTILAMAAAWERENVSALQQQPRIEQSQYVQEIDKAKGKLYHEFADNKHKWRFRGGRWTQYGVPVYPEVLATVGLSDSAPLGEMTGTYVAEIAMDGNKPKRVTRLRLATESVEF